MVYSTFYSRNFEVVEYRAGQRSQVLLLPSGPLGYGTAARFTHGISKVMIGRSAARVLPVVRPTSAAFIRPARSALPSVHGYPYELPHPY